MLQTIGKEFSLWDDFAGSVYDSNYYKYFDEHSFDNDVERYLETLLEKLEEKTGYPIVLNTSFNIKDQTMIMDPETAVKTFMDIGLDMLVIENFVITKR